MERKSITPRDGWEAKADDLGFGWHSPGRTYWDETAFHSLTTSDADDFFEASRAIDAMLQETIGKVIKGRQLPLFGYDARQIALIEKSWAESDGEPSLYSRFNLALTDGGIKLLSINADNPSGLFEASMVQREWLNDIFNEGEQFNSIHERLGELFGFIANQNRVQVRTDEERSRDNPTVHFTCMTPDQAKEVTLGYLLDVAKGVGVEGKAISLPDIGLLTDRRGDEFFVDMDNKPITTLVKLESLDFMLKDDFGDKLITETLASRMRLVEPAWKMLASNNRMLAALWEHNSYHPLLLQADVQRPTGVFNYVTKPFTSRDGQNVTIFDGDTVVAKTEGAFGESQKVYQELAVLGDNHPVYSTWVVGGEVVGLSVRESDTPIHTADNVRAVPHAIEA